MNKVIGLFATSLLIGCSYQNQDTAEVDADSSFVEVDAYHAVVYDINTGRDTIVEIYRDIEDGSIKVTDFGDTLYWLGGDTAGMGKYISSDEWSDYCKRKDELHKQ